MFKAKYLAPAVLGAALILSMSMPVSAAAFTSAQVSAIIALLQSFGVDQNAIARVQAVLAGNAAPTASCNRFVRNLSRGSTGSDVVALQNILIAEGYLASGYNTGFYGVLTERAVQLWQARHGVVNYGDPGSTGYGAVGPITRAKLQELYGCTAGPDADSAEDGAGATKPNPPSGGAIGGGGSGARLQACVFNGGTIDHGESIVAYQTASVPFGSSCTPQERTCRDGILSGDFGAASCTVGPAASCTWGSARVASGQSVTAYQALSVPSGAACASQRRTCTGGNLSGSYQYSSCAVRQAIACTINGITIQDGQSRDFYSTGTVASPASCESARQRRTCSGGVLTGGAQYGNLFCSATKGGSEVWLEPSLSTPDQNRMGIEPAISWQRTLSTISMFASYYPLITRGNPIQLQKLASVLKGNNVGFGFVTNKPFADLCATGSLDTLGERSAEADIPVMQRWLDAGGTIDMISLDGPMRRALYEPACKTFSPTIPIVARETVDYMLAVQDYLVARGQPMPKFNLISNFINWNYDGMPKGFTGAPYPFTDDYKGVFATLHQEAASRGVPFYSLILDDGEVVYGPREIGVDAQARSYGMKVMPYINTYVQTKNAASPNKDCTPLVPEGECNVAHRDWWPPDDMREQTWLAESLKKLGRWTTTLRRPDILYLGTWYLHPRNVLPETTFGTLTYDLLAVNNAYLGKTSATAMFKDAKAPVGFVGSSPGDTALRGWAYDPDDPGTSIYIHIYKDGKFVKSLAANDARPDVNTALGITGDHGFLWDIPAADLTAKHTWNIYAVNYRNVRAVVVNNVPVADKVELNNSPVITPLPPAPTGIRAGLSGGRVVLSWNPVPGAIQYSVTLNDPTNDRASCTNGWLCSGSTDVLNSNITAASFAIPIVSNVTYTWSVRARDAVGWGGIARGSFRN